MSSSYDLTQLDSYSFEHLTNAIAFRVLGPGLTVFASGADAGRDGYFEGRAPYPSSTENWDGIWYIQSKFLAPHLSKDPQKWLIEKIAEEIEKFKDPRSRRKWPDNWIISTNVDPTAIAETGSYDKAMKIVREANPELANRFAIWGGSKILNFLEQFSDIAGRYGHFLTPGQVLSDLKNLITESAASVDQIVKYLIIEGLAEQRHAKLEQAGYGSDKRPGIHSLFVDLPFSSAAHEMKGYVAEQLARASSQIHNLDQHPLQTAEWSHWISHPSRAPVWFIKAGPGRGKSTIGQYFCQIQRAAFICAEIFPSKDEVKNLSKEIQAKAISEKLWPASPRIPFYLELKSYSQWYGEQGVHDAKGILSYMSSLLRKNLEIDVLPETLKRAFRTNRWIFIFDGLDEVPGAIKDQIATEVLNFLNRKENQSDWMTICTSRPQGYSGQFNQIENVALIELLPLSQGDALRCAKPLLEMDRTKTEAARSYEVLTASMNSESVTELMTTPLQAHIMAVIVRNGQTPPERKWELYRRFYEVIRDREANRDLPDQSLAQILRREGPLLKAVHNRLGFVLHANAENADGAIASLNKESFRKVVRDVVSSKKEGDIDTIVETIVSASLDRLVLINTPDDGGQFRFDIRQLQEFFAAEFVYDGVNADIFCSRLNAIIGDAHWQEVVHFLVSALVELNRTTELTIAIQVMNALDTGSGEDRILRRQLALGGLIAARLLADGVLEQDKEVRNSFRSCISTLSHSRHPGAIEPLTEIRTPASRRWLLDLLLTDAEELSLNESEGAFNALWTQLEDTDPFIERWRKLWSNRTKELSGNCTWLWEIEYEERHLLSQTWQIQFCLESLFLPHDLLYNQSDLIAKVVNKNTWSEIDLERTLKISEFQIKLLNLFRFARREAGIIKNYGAISVHCRTTASIEEGYQSSSIKIDEIPKGSLACLVALALKYASTRKKDDCLNLIDAFQGKTENIQAIPDRIRPSIWLPSNFDSIREIKDKIETMSDEEIANQFDRTDVASVHVSHVLTTGGEGTDRSLSVTEAMRLFEDFPFWAMRFLVFPVNIEILRDKKIIEAIYSKLEQEEKFRRSIPFCILGLVFAEKDNKAEMLRHMVASSRKNGRPNNDLFRSRLLFPFEIRFPDEVEFLGDVLWQALHPSRATYWGDGEFKAVDVRILVKKYIPSIVPLKAIIINGSSNILIKGRALLLSILHPDGGEALAHGNIKLLIEYASIPMEQGALAFALCMENLNWETNAKMRTLLSKMMEQESREDGFDEQWSAVLTSWREKGRSPVSKSGKLSEWLECKVLTSES